MCLNSRLDICLVMSFTGVVSLLLERETLFPSSPAAERRQNETWNIAEVLQNVENGIEIFLPAFTTLLSIQPPGATHYSRT